MKLTDSKTGEEFNLTDQVVELLDNLPGGAVFFARELEYVKTKSYDIKYPELKFRELFSVDNSAGAGAETITYETYDQIGMAEYIDAYSKDLPRADIAGKETIVPVRELGISFAYTTSDIRKANRSGKNLSQRRMDAAVKGMETKMNIVAFFGDALRGHIGFFTHPNIPTAAAPNGGGGFPEWSTKTPYEILADLNEVANDIWEGTNMVEVGNTIILPPAQYRIIKQTRLDSGTDTTILQFFLANNDEITKIVALNECKGTVRAVYGLSAVDVIACYNDSPDKLAFEEPMPLLWQPEQRDGLEIKIPGEASIGGMNVYYPLSANILTDI